MSSSVMRADSRAPSGRGRAALALDWWPASLPAGTTIEPRTLVASDGEVSRGTLYTLGNARAVFCLMHPRQDLQRHPLIPGLLAAGFAVWAQASREVGNDLRLVHECVLLDVAEGAEFLRDRGFEKIVLIGISGGAGLYSFYAEQSLLTADKRFGTTPAGAPSGLPEANMPAPDGLVLVAPHPGQGRLLLGMIDPSVADESDPFSVVPELDAFAPANGFGDSPDGAHYDAAFVARYRRAQEDRVARIDATARELLADQRAARDRVKAGTATGADRGRSVLTPVITTYRTDADLRSLDLSIDPSDRPYGSVVSRRPAVSNYGVNGFGRLTVPASWLSTWSGLTSRAASSRSLAGVTTSTLVVEYTGDCSVFPSDVQDILRALASGDVTHVRVRADHFGRALAPDEPSGIEPTVQAIAQWAAARSLS